MQYILDIEADGIDNPQKIHCVVLYDIQTEKETVYEPPFNGLAEHLSCAKRIIGHNIIHYDSRWLSSLLSIQLDSSVVTDTLLLSQLLNYRIEGGHSLEAWGNRLDFPKIGLNIRDWSVYTPEMKARCINDCRLNAKVYNVLRRKLIDREDHAFDRAIDLEHQMAWVCLNMHIDGFGFDVDRARTLLAELDAAVTDLDKELLNAFPPKARDDGVIVPRLTKQGTISRTNMRWYTGSDWSIFEAGCAFTRIRWEPFNPGSPSQIVERLDAAGWKPSVKTKGGDSWQINEENLSTIPDTAPSAARLLVKRLMLASRVRTLKEWLAFYRTETGCVHGRFNTLGTWTHRMSHSNPNLGNVAAAKSIKYKGKELKDEAIRLGSSMRGLFRADPGSWLVGADMDAAHLRIFAHLICDKGLIDALVTGDKAKGTDPHTINRQKLGPVCTDRDLAKTAVYTFLNGGGAKKFASIFGCSYRDAKEALESFIRSYPGLSLLKTRDIPKLAKQGYFPGIDGRFVVCTSEHHMLACMLQNAEAIMMKQACLNWRKELDKLGIDYRLVNFVHDEWQTEVRGDYTLAEFVGRLQADSIQEVGRHFGIRCPMAGNYNVGKSWADTH